MAVLWVIPALAVLLGAVALAVLARGAAHEGRALMGEISRFGELHVALERVNQELVRSRAIVEELGPR